MNRNCSFFWICVYDNFFSFIYRLCCYNQLQSLDVSFLYFFCCILVAKIIIFHSNFYFDRPFVEYSKLWPSTRGIINWWFVSWSTYVSILLKFQLLPDIMGELRALKVKRLEKYFSLLFFFFFSIIFFFQHLDVSNNELADIPASLGTIGSLTRVSFLSFLFLLYI